MHEISPHNVVNFGLQLKIKRTRIEVFEIKYASDMHQVLREILNEALKHDPPLTRIDIVSALRYPSVREERVASQIERWYLQQLSQTPQSSLHQEGPGLLTPQHMLQSTSLPPPSHAALNVTHPTQMNVQQISGTVEPPQWPGVLTSNQTQMGPSRGVSQFHHQVAHQHTGNSVSRPPVPRYPSQDYMPQGFTHAGQPTPININFWGQFPPHFYQLPQPPRPTQYAYGEGHQPQNHQTFNVPQHLGQQDQHLPLVQDYPSLYTPSPLNTRSYSHRSSLSESGYSSQQSVPVSTSSVDPPSACIGSIAKRSAVSSDSDSGVPAYKKQRQQTLSGSQQIQYHQGLNVSQHNIGQQNQHLPLGLNYHSIDSSPIPSPLAFRAHSLSSLPASGIPSNSGQQPVLVSAGSVPRARRIVADSDSHSGVAAHTIPRQHESIYPASPQIQYCQRSNVSRHIGQQDQHIPLGQDYHSMDNSPIASPLQCYSQYSLPASGTSSNSGQQPMLVSAGSVQRARRIVADSDTHSGVPTHKRPRQSSPGSPLSCLLPSPSFYRSSPGSPYIQPSSTPSLPAPTVTNADVITFIDYVKEKYRAKVVERDIKWSLSPTIEYINLACIDRRCIKSSREYEDVTRAMVQDGSIDAIQEKKGPIEFGEIAKGIFLPSKPGPGSWPVDDRRLILVEGAPGVGKSTFAWEFCRRWMEGEVVKQYNLVLLLRLRDEGVRNAAELQELICHPLSDVSKAMCRELATSRKFHTLIILEGYDELPDNQRNSSSSIFNRLISGELLPFATILVTSRPWATGDIRRKYEGHIYQHIEVLGFTKRQITEYIKKTVPKDQVNDLNSYLERHPQIKCSMYIPLNTAIVVAVYKEGIKNDEDKLPNTVTELYSCCIKILISRHLNSKESPKEENRTVVPVLNISVPFEVQRNFVSMCELAHKGIVGSDKEIKLIFSDSELPRGFDNLGFMDSATELYVTGETVSSHNFLHLTFQEFLAAVHISSLSPDEQVKYFTSSGSMKGRLKVLLKFLAGLRKLDCFTKDNVSQIVTVPSTTVSSKYITPCDIAVDTDVVNWLFEAQSENAISLILGENKVEFKASKSQMYPMDYYSLGYCISHSQCQWVLCVTGRMTLSKEKTKVLAAGAANGTGVGKVVGLGEDLLINTDVKMLLTEWRSILCLNEFRLSTPSLLPILDLSDLKVLEIFISRILTDDYMNIANFLSTTTCLKEFIFRVVHSTEDVGHIIEALATNQLLPLENLHLEVGQMHETHIAFLITFVRNSTTLQQFSIRTPLIATASIILEFLNTIYHHPTLQEKSLNLKEWACKVTADADVNALSQLCFSSYQVSMRNDFIKYIGQLSDEGAIVLAEILKHKYRLLNLNLSHGGTSNDGVTSLAKALHHNSTIQRLILTDNSISGDGAVALAQTLCHNSTILRLELQTNSIGDEGAIALGQVLYHNSTLNTLNLMNNSIGNEGACTLAQSLHQNSTLRDLNLSENNIGDEGASALAQSLHHNSILRCLNLSKNSIDDEGASALAQSLHRNSTLFNLNLSGNSIGDEGASALAQSLHHNSTLRDLNLSENNIGDEGASALAQSLHHNSTLRDLNLSENSIGDEGASALAQSLHHNSTLRDLNLSENSIGDEGASALAQSLHHNSTLRDLNLSENSIGDEGASALAQSLHHNSTLRDLNLSKNSIGDEGASALAQSLHHNSTLRDLNLSENNVGDEGASAMVEIHNSLFFNRHHLFHNNC